MQHLVLLEIYENVRIALTGIGQRSICQNVGTGSLCGLLDQIIWFGQAPFYEGYVTKM